MTSTGSQPTPVVEADEDAGVMSAGPPMVSFVAPSGTGKTTLLSGVIELLSSQGYRVGALKHDAHRIELDTEGKDSWRLREAGAASTMLMGRNQLAWFGEDGQAPPLDQMAQLFFGSCDLLLVEGFRSAGLPTVLVARPDHVDDRWEPPDPSLVIATVSPDEVAAVASLIEEMYLRAG